MGKVRSETRGWAAGDGCDGESGGGRSNRQGRQTDRPVRQGRKDFRSDDDQRRFSGVSDAGSLRLHRLSTAKPQQVAPLWHTLGLLAILLAISLSLFRMQSLSPAVGNKRELHRGNVALYLLVIVSERALVFYIWLGGRPGGPVPF